MRKAVLVGVAMLLLIFVFLEGFSLGRDKEASLVAPGKADVVFAQEMSVHQAQGVDMAERIRARSEDRAITTLATDIALGHQAQIGRFQGWLDAWGEPPTTTTGLQTGRHNLPAGLVARSEVAALSRTDVGIAERRFLELMITHHRRGIAMANTAAVAARLSEVKRLARSIVTAQSEDIASMQDLLRARVDGPPITPSP